MEKLQGNFLLRDGSLSPVSGFTGFSGKPGTFVYEVLRVISGVPLFLGEHIARLHVSVKALGLPCPFTSGKIEKELKQLIRANNMEAGNIKMVFRFFDGAPGYWFYQVPHSYPSEADYINGVEVGFLHIERSNPVAKTTEPTVRALANEAIVRNKYYEVLLVDSKGNIREGSRSNVFFIRGREVYTPPAGQVLRGITRQKVIEAIQQLGYGLVEEPVGMKATSFDAVFITSTSAKVLPVKRWPGQHFDTANKVYTDIREAYEGMVKKYIKEASENYL
ncbi:hypothetical protein MNBD_BACTEROID01-1252 [hydrothermal vent metagenome]|uniref:Branched-chain amino acid aminotransferase n=1 Tax=hydrothermal vent metagenome TaxID=652676 RepID=A0A3B0TY33_9ZZZZ